MNASGPARPVLATVICIYEVCTVALGISARVSPRHAHRVLLIYRTPLAPTNPLIAPLSWLAYALVLAAVVALWQMRRPAFYLLGARLAVHIAAFSLGLSRLLSIFRQPPAMPAGMSALPTITIFIIVLLIAGSWSISIAIVWYVGVITSPKHTSPPVAEPAAGI